ncbi:MAG: GNAT family N-acetyltransferase [Firmicutes bacterium]|nr:GNAT family N-acetyltransferase [Bacillota bacterium]
MKLLESRNADRALALYNQSIRHGEQNLKILTKQEFSDLFLTPSKDNLTFASYTDDENGFIIGTYDGGIDRFFLTMLVVDPAFRRKGYGSHLVGHLQYQMDELSGKLCHKLPPMEISYFDPVNIRWILPGTNGHTHQNSQGVKLGSPAHLFFKNLGFRDFSTQNTYHLLLSDYIWSKKRLEIYEERAAKAGFSVELYDPEKHTGMQDVVDDLNNDLWNWQIPQEMNRPEGPRPIVIVNDHGRIGGFAGPIVVENDGRCWLLGVAVHSRCRGSGCATLLFNRMCQEFKEAGSVYLTLFTGEDNPARKIYESAGMKILYSWATMRRTGI